MPGFSAQLKLQTSQLKILLGDKIVLNKQVFVVFNKANEINMAYW